MGRGLSEVHDVLPWESAEVAPLLAGGPLTGPLADRLARYDSAVAYTRSETLLANLRALLPRVLARDPEPARNIHASLWLSRATEEPAADEDPPSLEPSAEEDAEARRHAAGLKGGFLAIHPGSGSPRKNWAVDRFAALALALAPECSWLLIEGPADREPASALRNAAPGAITARELPPRVLGALLARAGLFVGNDSGVAHLAAAFGAPTLALYGPTDPEVWGPVGPRVKTLRAKDARLESLAVERVLDAARSWVA